MAQISDIIPGASSKPSGFTQSLTKTPWFAIVSIPVPLAIADPLWVIIPDISGAFKWGPCRWTPSSASQSVNVAEPAQASHVGGVAETPHFVTTALINMPVAGQQCLVLFDNQMNPWVLMYGTFPKSIYGHDPPAPSAHP